MIFLLIALGYIIGGFLAMFIYRWPREIRIFSKRRDPEGNLCKWYESIPIIGFIITKGKYSNKEKKSILEVIVPILNILVYVTLYLTIGNVVGNYLFMAFISVMIVVIFIDGKFMLIPDRVHIALIIIGITACLCDHFLYYDEFGEIFHMEWYSRLIGFAVGLFPMWILGAIISKIKKTDALGGGDVKMLGAAGLFLGWQNILLAIVLGSVIALPIEKLLQLFKIKKADEPFAFGPYLALSMIICCLVGNTIISWYLGLFAI